MLTHQHPTKYVLDLVSSEKVTVQLKIYFNYNLALREFNINPYRPNVLTRFHQGFINYNFFVHHISRMQNLFGTRPCTWEIVPVKGQMFTLLIITRYGDRTCTKLLLKLLAAKNDQLHFCRVCCSFPVNYTISVYMMTTHLLHSCTLGNLFT